MPTKLLFSPDRIPHSMTLSVQSDDHYMELALEEAQKAYDKGEIPVGAVVECEQRILARTHNSTEQLTDVTAHAEVMAITAASQALGGKFLERCRFFITLEPCVMCAGALYWARPAELILGAKDPKKGFTLTDSGLLHPKTSMKEGVKKEEASELLRDFFRTKRDDP
ncbi:MAG: nucleoside deaminase [Flavobacteriales bacterium]